MKYIYALFTILIIILLCIGFVITQKAQTPEPEIVLPEGYDNLEDFVIAKTKENMNFGTTKPAGLFTYYLSGAGISSSATSLKLNSLTLPQNDYPIQDADLSSTFYMTLEPGNTSRQEFVSCTTVGSNSGSAVTISGCTRGLSPISPYNASSTLAFAHSGGSAVIFSDSPSLYKEYAGLQNNEWITGTWGFSVVPTTTDECTASTEFCSKSYIDSSVNQGAATSTETTGGIVELATALEVASSTDAGASKPLVLQAKNATDTPSDVGCATGYTSVGGAGCSIVANLLGKLNQAWLDLTAAFTWIGTQLFQGAVTVTGDFIVNNASSTITHLYVADAATTTSLVIGSTVPPTTPLTSGQLYVGGNATSTGSVDAASFCFSGVDCFSSLWTLWTNKNVFTGALQGKDNNGSGASTTDAVELAYTTGGSTGNESVFFSNNVVDMTKDFDMHMRVKVDSTTASNKVFGLIDTAAVEAAGDHGDNDIAAFLIDDTALYALTGNGSNATEWSISGITLTNWNDYRITRSGSTITFYVNDTLQRTLNTTSPDLTTGRVVFGVDTGADAAKKLEIMSNWIFVGNK